ncbi:MAG: T9SS type A sorting domain-containing protein [Bacteroidia bacterium]
MRQRLVIVTAASTITALVIVLILFFNIGNVKNAFAAGTTYYSRASGNWSDTNTWSTSANGGSAASSVPQAGDEVIISGYTISVNSNAAAKSVTVLQNKTKPTSLQVIDGKTLDVSANIELLADEHQQNITFNISGDKTAVNVGGDLTISKTKGSSKGEINLTVQNTSILAIAGSLITNYKAGQDEINIVFSDYASLSVGEDIILTDTKGKGDLNVIVEDNAIANIDGDISFEAVQKSQITFTMTDNSQTFLGGSIIKQDANKVYGSFQSTDDSKLTLTGKSMQVIVGSSTNSDSFIIENLVINSSKDQNVDLAGHVLVTGQLTFIKGIVNSSESAMITLGSSAKSSGSSASSYVDGPIAKTGSTAFVFPTGDAGKYAPLGISSPASTSTFQAEYFNNPYQSGTATYQSPVTNVSSVEYWQLKRTAGTGNTEVQLNWLDAQHSGITNMSDLQVAYIDTVKNTWIGVGGKTVSLSTTQGSVTSNSLANFGTFTFGSSGGSALPVSLINFDAKAKTNYVQISWATAWETNNDYFTVERSEDGKNFSKIATVKGAGNATEKLKYAYDDKDPLPGISYYRLKQTDFNGQYEYFQVKPVNIPYAKIENVGPNPFTDNINVSYNMLKEAPVTIQLLNAGGQIVFEEAAQAGYGNNSYLINNQQQLPKGIYVLRINAAGEPVNYKLVKS